MTTMTFLELYPHTKLFGDVRLARLKTLYNAFFVVQGGSLTRMMIFAAIRYADHIAGWKGKHAGWKALVEELKKLEKTMRVDCDFHNIYECLSGQPIITAYEAFHQFLREETTV